MRRLPWNRAFVTVLVVNGVYLWMIGAIFQTLVPLVSVRPWNAGLPAKTGVGGGIVAVVPGKMSIVGFAPPLDQFGNSVRAQEAIRYVAEQLDLSIVQRRIERGVWVPELTLIDFNGRKLFSDLKFRCEERCGEYQKVAAENATTALAGSR